MRVKITLVFAGIISCLILSGCEIDESEIPNQQYTDITYHFDRAIVSLPSGEIASGKVDSWTDYDDSDMIQVVIDGKTYYTHGSNVNLIND